MPLLGGLEGRASECVVTPAGRCVPALLLQRGMRLQADLFWEYQLQQRRSDEVEVLVVPKGEYGDTLAAELSRHLEAFLGNEVHVVVSRVGHIPRDPSGKQPILKTSLDFFAR
ncbi:MAG: hypothetical protein H5T95_12605 [Firmicutes bacterium]|nr:hypothetical protein [Bacillota bacterium]